MNNAQVALQAAALVHQKVAAGGGITGGNTYMTTKGDIKIDTSSPEQVLATADKFLDWLTDNS